MLDRKTCISLPKAELYHFDEENCAYKPIATNEGAIPVVVMGGSIEGGGSEGGITVNFLNGSGVPTSDIGTDGDIYLDSASGDLYKKESSTWITIANLKGAKGDKGDTGDKGEKGSEWIFREEPPTTQGKCGDFFLNTLTFNVYTKNSLGSWIRIGCIKGDKGDAGFGTEEQYNDIISRLEALENAGTS